MSDKIELLEETMRGINPVYWPEYHYYFRDRLERLVVKRDKLNRR